MSADLLEETGEVVFLVLLDDPGFWIDAFHSGSAAAVGGDVEYALDEIRDVLYWKIAGLDGVTGHVR